MPVYTIQCLPNSVARGYWANCDNISLKGNIQKRKKKHFPWDRKKKPVSPDTCDFPGSVSYILYDTKHYQGFGGSVQVTRFRISWCKRMICIIYSVIDHLKSAPGDTRIHHSSSCSRCLAKCILKCIYIVHTNYISAKSLMKNKNY